MTGPSPFGLQGRSWGRCAVHDCRRLRADGGRLCPMHRMRLYEHGDVNHVPQRGGGADITPEQRAAVREAMSKFKNPVAIARSLGISQTSVRKIMKGDQS